MSKNGEIYTAGKKFYTAAGTDGMDKFHLCTKVPIPDFMVTRLVTENAIRVGLRGAIWYYVDLEETKKQFVPEDVVMEGIMRNALEKSGLPKMYITDKLIRDLIEALEKEGYGKEGILRKFENLPQS